MKSTAHISLIGISLVSGVLIGIAGTLLMSSPAKADKPTSADVTPHAAYVESQAPSAVQYLPSQFYEAQRDAKQNDLPAQF